MAWREALHVPILALAAVSGALGGGATAWARLPDFTEALRAEADRLAAITSDEEALTLFATRLGRLLDLEPGLALSGKAPAEKSVPDSQEFADTAVKLVADLAAWQLAASLESPREGATPSDSQASPAPAPRHQAWLLTRAEPASLRQALALQTALRALPDGPASSGESPQGYEAYAAYLDRTYPLAVGSDASWSALVEREGAAGLRRRLEEFWNGRGGAGGGQAANEPPEGVRQEIIARYVAVRLRPTLSLQVQALIRHAAVEAERDALRDWIRLHGLAERIRVAQGLARLCGTWQWTIHNHQNHQDLKTVIIFPPPGTTKPPGAVPQKILVLGDAVYLRWEFRGGFQEDSLLLSGGGQRLEGTFVNSAGAWGSITGKRTGPCGQ